jgi:hypothetical protein
VIAKFLSNVSVKTSTSILVQSSVLNGVLQQAVTERGYIGHHELSSVDIILTKNTPYHQQIH